MGLPWLNFATPSTLVYRSYYFHRPAARLSCYRLLRGSHSESFLGLHRGWYQLLIICWCAGRYGCRREGENTKHQKLRAP